MRLFRDHCMSILSMKYFLVLIIFLSIVVTFTNNLSLFALIQNNDGEIDAEDLKTYWTKLKRILTKNMPDATGFSLGFFYGLTN